MDVREFTVSYLSGNNVRGYVLFSCCDIIAYLSGGRRDVGHSFVALQRGGGVEPAHATDDRNQRNCFSRRFRTASRHARPAIRCPEATRCRRRNKIAKRNGILLYWFRIRISIAKLRLYPTFRLGT